MTGRIKNLIWLDDVEGNAVWSVHPWGITTIALMFGSPAG